MPRKNINFELDFMKKDIFPRFTVKQFDDVSFNIKPKNQGLDYDTTGMTGKIFVGVNNDMFMQTTGITVSSNNIKVLLDKNVLQNRGRAYAEIELTDSNGTITSSSFIFNIDEKIGEGAKIPGGYEGFVAKYERLISEFKAQVNSTIDNCNANINSTINNCNKTVDNKLNDVDNFVDNKILDIEKRFNTLTSSQQQASEVIDARDGEVSLKARLDRDLYKDGISLSDRIEAIEGLKDSQNMKYETDKGYLICKETKNGVIDDLKIEGKTLVNLYQPKHFYPHSGGWNTIILKVDLLKTNTKYYYKIFNLPSGFKHVITDENNVYLGDYTTSSFNTFTTINTITPTITLHINNQAMEELILEQLQGLQILILEGDHTQNPPSYFEGLMSVGQDVDKIEVLSNNKNLCPQNFLLDTKMEATGSTSYNKGCIVGKDFIKVLPNTKYSLGDNRDNTLTTKLFVEYDKDKNFIRRIDGGKTGIITTSSDVYYIKIYIYDTTSNLSCENIKVQLNKGEVLSEYTPHQSDKKQILFYNENGELEPIQELHEWDSIEKHSDNKWYYHKRSGKVVLNGSEDSRFNATYQNTLRFSFTDIFRGIKFIDTITSIKMISNSFKNIAANVSSISDIEGISVHSSSVTCINILKSKLSTQDVTGFKQWLQANPVTVVYQLAEEEVYELAPLHLDSYANETLILCNSGAISPKMEFSITSHINELVKSYGERINLLEEKVYQYMVTQNRMQLASTYSADSVTFKVDYFSLCGDEENYDEDLYNLILNNILVGKDNYNYDKMFTIILDYASWNQISWEQFDILVGLMDIQHNPPVEELPTEDEIEEDIIEEDIIENEETPVE